MTIENHECPWCYYPVIVDTEKGTAFPLECTHEQNIGNFMRTKKVLSKKHSFNDEFEEGGLDSPEDIYYEIPPPNTATAPQWTTSSPTWVDAVPVPAAQLIEDDSEGMSDEDYASMLQEAGLSEEEANILIEEDAISIPNTDGAGPMQDIDLMENELEDF